MNFSKKLYLEGETPMISVSVNGNIFLNRPVYSPEDILAVEGYLLYAENANKGFEKKELKSSEKKALLDKAKELGYLSE